MDRETKMPEDNDSIGRRIHRALASGEAAADRIRRGFSARRGRNSPGHLAAYGGYVDRFATHLSGRVLSKAPGGGPLDDDSVWENLANTWRRWESDEVAGAEVSIRCGGHEATVISDEEGYYEATLPPVISDGLWTTAEARVRVDGREISAVHQVLAPPLDAAFGIVSDLDDTVIHTGITSLLLAARLTFLENAKTRKPLDGVAELYAALQKGISALAAVNPIFYVSSSPWNLHDLLWDFIALNDIPRGPVLLRDFGLDAEKFIKEKGHGHKLRKALSILDGYPALPFVLIGDSGQEDATIYAEICAIRPGRVKAVYIRDVDPDLESDRDAMVHRAVEVAKSHGVTMILAPNSKAMSEHASRVGLIPAAAVPEVIEEIRKDEQRPA